MPEKRNRSRVPRYIRDLTPYQAGKTIAEVKEAYDPPRISKLASNENRLGCSPKVQAAIYGAFEEIQDYPDPLARALRAKIAGENRVAPENIIVAGGSESIIAILCRTFFSDGDELLTADATFVGIYVHAGVQQIDLRKIPLTSDYRFDLEAMAGSVSDRTKMIYIANPNNPTGTYVTKNEFKTFLGNLPEDVLVVMDEAYFEYASEVPDYPHALDFSFPNLLVLRTFSKAYGLAGLRVGYAVGPEELIRHMMKTKLAFEPTTMAQAAALAALEDPQFLNKSRKMVDESRKRLYRFLDSRGVSYVRTVSNAVLMLLASADEASAFTQSMLEQGVILRQAQAFGIPRGVRVTLGTDHEMEHFEQSFEKTFVR